MIAFGAFVVTQIEQELKAVGKIDPNKLYLVYYHPVRTPHEG